MTAISERQLDSEMAQLVASIRHCLFGTEQKFLTLISDVDRTAAEVEFFESESFPWSMRRSRRVVS